MIALNITIHKKNSTACQAVEAINVVVLATAPSKAPVKIQSIFYYLQNK
jgi:hypothetical protein